MTPERALRFVWLGLVGSGVLAAFSVSLVPEKTLPYLEIVPAKAFLALISWSAVTVAILYLWSWFFLRDPLRFVAQQVRTISAIAVLYVGGISFAIPSAITFSAQNAADSELTTEITLSLESLVKAASPVVLVIVFAAFVAALVFLSWLYFLIAQYEHQNGLLFENRSDAR